MRPVLTRAEMAEVDALAGREVGVEVLVRRAGTAAAHAALSMLGGAYGRRVVVVAGKGHNGDDGRIAAGLLERRGARVVVLPPAAGVDPGAASGTGPVALPACHLVVDAAFGTGFRGSYRAPAVPQRPDGRGPATVLAVDIPSGVDSDTGEAGPSAVWADRTVTFGALKPGLLLGAGPDHAGEVRVEPIGLPVGQGALSLVEDADVARLLPPRRRDGHKWDRAVYVAAGSPGMLGAAALAATGAGRAGAGMLRLGSPGVPPGSVPVTEAVARPLPPAGWADAVLAELGRCKALVVGPGLGTGPETAESLRRLVAEAPVAVVVDADGLSVAGSADELSRLADRRTAPLVLTPHDGEYARLAGARPGPDRVAAARDLARRVRATVLLKGSPTVVAEPGGSALLVSSGSARLSTAGSGDVLSGVIGAFLARGLEPLQAAGLAAHVHGRAAAVGGGEGLLAGDLPRLVADVLDSIGPRAAASRVAGAGAPGTGSGSEAGARDGR